MINDFFETNDYIKLNKYQRKVVLTKRKNVLVLASAGTGKTSTIITRIKYLLEVLKVNKEEILCISFTNDAVNNIKEKVDIPNIYTFHKLALSIIGNRYEILSENMVLDIVMKSFNNMSLLSLYGIPKKEMYKLITTFINLFKSNGYDINYFYKIINKSSGKDKILLKEIMKCYICYDSYLKSENLIDFNDMINLAIKEVDNKNLNYKYIIIDEYQDTSLNKFKLINKIRKKCKSHFLAVGDDYQSIYRFTGSNIDIITKFRKYFLFSKIYKLKYTYRNSIELNYVAKKFITKNNRQIKKNIKAFSSILNPVEIIYYNDLNNAIKKVIKENNIENLFILSRNNKDLEDIYVNYKKMSVHKSKGLEEDFVFLINVNNNKNGFPNKYTDHYILKYVNNYKEYYPYEEERRLFYVALTRCKKKIYIFVPINNESVFIKEIKRYKNVLIREI